MSGSITLQFVGSNDILSDTIKLFERGWCSHVDAVMPDGMLLGARFSGGVAIRPPDYEAFPRKLQVHLPAEDAVAAAFYDALRSQLGKPYDVEAIAAFAFDRDWRATDHWFCSEIQAWALERAGYFPHPLAATDSTITPRDLLLILSPFSADATLVG